MQKPGAEAGLLFVSKSKTIFFYYLTSILANGEKLLCQLSEISFAHGMRGLHVIRRCEGLDNVYECWEIESVLPSGSWNQVILATLPGAVQMPVGDCSRKS